jgi:UDP:flavonoid glycosyltransferase YjiC (YdhE family)
MRVLCSSIPSDDLGLPSRLLPVAAKLRARGHEVVFANPAPAPSRLVESAGFENIEWLLPLVPFAERKRPIPVKQPAADAEQAMCALYGDPDCTVREITNWVQIIEEFRAEVLLDSFGPAGCAAALIVGTPLVEILQGNFHPDSRFAWWLPATGSDTPSAAEGFNRALDAAGLGEVDRATRLLVAGTTVVVGSPSTDPVPDPTLPHVGALAWGDPNAELPSGLPEAGVRPLVFLYGGNPTYGRVEGRGVIVDAAVDALGSLDIDVVLGAGNQSLPDSLPANFTALAYAPGQALARRADLMIHHGGHGSTLTALAAGTPAVVIATSIERQSNARRMAALGAGICLVPDGDPFTRQQFDADLLGDAVQSILTDASYRQAAQLAQAELAALSGPAGVADLVEAATR